MQQPNSMLGAYPHLIRDENCGSEKGIELNVSRLLNSLRFGTSVLPESRPAIDSQLMQQLHQLEKDIHSVLQKQETKTKSECAVPSNQTQHHHPQHHKLDKVVTKDKASDKDSASVIAPCPARGMPLDHNFKVCLLSHCSIHHRGIFLTFLFG